MERMTAICMDAESVDVILECLEARKKHYEKIIEEIKDDSSFILQLAVAEEQLSHIIQLIGDFEYYSDQID